MRFGNIRSRNLLQAVSWSKWRCPESAERTNILSRVTPRSTAAENWNSQSSKATKTWERSRRSEEVESTLTSRESRCTSEIEWLSAPTCPAASATTAGTIFLTTAVKTRRITATILAPKTLRIFLADGLNTCTSYREVFW